MTAARSDAHPRAVSVLVVDDDPLIRRMLRHALTGHGGLTVLAEAGDGHDAVLLAGALEPDVVVLDLAMPTVGGLEATPAIRAALPDCRILVFSASDADGAEAAALAAGADLYVEKGLDFAAVADAVHALGLTRS